MQEYVQIAEAVLSTLCQCMTRESCRNYVLNLNPVDLFVSMSKSFIFGISNNAKMILSSLSQYLPHNYRSSFKLTVEEIEDMLQSLTVVLESGIPEGELFFSAMEILQNLTFFVQFEPNRQVMSYSSVYKSIAHLLHNGDAIEKRVACELLWKLVTKPMSEITLEAKTKTFEDVEEIEPHEYVAESGLMLFLLERYPEILAIVSKFSQNEETQAPVFFCTCLVLMKESTEIIGKGTPLLLS